MKQCWTCGVVKEDSEFNKNCRELGGLQRDCKLCKRMWNFCHYYKEKERARRAVYRAIKKGILKRPDCCSNPDCDNVDNIQAHHSDYHRPLDVCWMCPSCHRAVHDYYARHDIEVYTPWYH